MRAKHLKESDRKKVYWAHVHGEPEPPWQRGEDLIPKGKSFAAKLARVLDWMESRERKT